MANMITIVIPFRRDYEVEDWCIQNLNDDGQLRIKCDFDVDQRTQTFIFENETDAMAFKLRWL